MPQVRSRVRRIGINYQTMTQKGESPRNPLEISALFWDSDNTLVSTAALHWQKHVAVLSTLGIDLPETMRDRIFAHNGQQNWEWLHREMGLNMPCEAYLSQIDRWFMNHLDQLQPRDGVMALIDWADSLNIPQCVVSNGRRASVEMALDAVGITPRMRFLLCKEDYEGKKPDPAPYLVARERLCRETEISIPAGSCLAIEDEPKGVRSAAAAGMQVVHRLLQPDDPGAPEADHVVYHAADLLDLIIKG